MFKKIAFCLITILFVLSMVAFIARKQSNHLLVQCDPKIENHLVKIQQLSNARKLIQDIQREGAIQIQLTQIKLAEEFGAFWDPDSRTIFVNGSNQRTEGDIIGSILFELHNAAIDSKLNHLNHLASRQEISRDNYIREVEYLEYLNSLATAKLAQQGIDQGLFPKNARLPTYGDFDEHFRMQQYGGHSAWIGKIYDEIVAESQFRQNAL